MTPNQSPKHDTFFYCDTVVFQVEDTLFSIPRYGPAKDGAFDTLFEPPCGALSAGTHDDEPIFLADVSVSEFRLLLRMICFDPDHIATFDTLDEWTSILRLSTRWSLGSIRAATISGAKSLVNKLPIVEKILLAERCNVQEWLEEGYEALIGREAMITSEERDMLGWETYGRLMELREKCWVDTKGVKKISAAAARGMGATGSQKKKGKKGKSMTTACHLLGQPLTHCCRPITDNESPGGYYKGKTRNHDELPGKQSFALIPRVVEPSDGFF
ncbi:unnamed protein product [Peniophora sp. CBMAI 1063]|nr:unnamed protein product [Peniophora sp. CBMAI 1063]